MINRRKNIIIILVPILGLIFSCKNEIVEDNKFKNKEITKKVNQNNPDVLDILRFKTNEKSIEDKPIVSFTSANIKFTKDLDYKFEVKGVSNIDVNKLSSNYYVIINLYPYDDDITLLAENRRKYKFEMFSTKIRKTNDSQEILISRKIDTRVNKVRALIITILRYKDKKKIQEIIMENVAFY
tara:strand:+ start:142 stop:690 length:549 start_codon:yes stop_codon:yes gene_type:complete